MRMFDRMPVRLTRILRRATKVGLAAALATLIAQLLNLQNPWFATLAAIVAMEITIRASLRTARNALIGAVAGAGAGLLVALFAKEQFWAVAIVVTVVLVVFGFLRMENAGRQAALVASVIVLVPERVGFSTTDFAWIRLAETVIGITVALVVNRFVFPPRAYRSVRRDLAAAYRHLADLFTVVADECAGAPRDDRTARLARQEVRADLRGMDAFWDEAMSEHPPHEVLAPHWRATTRRIWEHAAVTDDALREIADSALLDETREEAAALATAITDALRVVSHSFTDQVPIPDFPGLESARAALMHQVELVEDHGAPPPFNVTLQVLGVVNGMSVVAAHLIDVGATTDPESIHRDPPEPEPETEPVPESEGDAAR
jgi:uncharacterized membrane protein YccC